MTSITSPITVLTKVPSLKLPEQKRLAEMSKPTQRRTLNGWT
jgi:hypothetical protein